MSKSYLNQKIQHKTQFFLLLQPYNHQNPDINARENVPMEWLRGCVFADSERNPQSSDEKRFDVTALRAAAEHQLSLLKNSQPQLSF